MSKQGLNYFASRVQGGGFGGPMLVVPSPAGFDVFSDAGGGKVEDQHYQIEYERIDSEEKLLSWILTLCDKSWVTNDVIRCLIHQWEAKFDRKISRQV